MHKHVESKDRLELLLNHLAVLSHMLALVSHLSSNPSHEEDSSIRFSFSMKTEAWRVILVPQTFLIPVLMKSHLGSKGGWRGVMNLRPKLLVHELLASGYKKSRCHEDGDLKYEERRGV
ncbi:hypothetical protein YC2023_024256 [Brassica napus]